MTCRRLVQGDKVVGHICGPQDKHVKATGRRYRRWCFTCRKRVLMVEKRVYDPGGWYDPHYFEECPNGSWHQTDFPT